MKNTILSMILFAAISATAQDIDWATRVRCELQTAGGTSLQDLTFSQGSTPLLAMDQYRLGRAFDASTNVVATFILGPSALSEYYVAVTNTSVSGNSFLIQLPTVGTNTTTGAWWYTVYFEKDGRKYWTGNGIVDIEATTSTADGLTWQEIVSGDETDPTYQNWRDSGEPEQMITDATNGLLSVELDPTWAAVSNTVTAGAAAGDTALQVELDSVAYPVATNALAIAQAAVQTELDARALKLYHYGDPDIAVTPEAAFGFSAGEITSYDFATYGADVVIPYEIGGVAVTGFGYKAFSPSEPLSTIKSVQGPKSVTSIGNEAFAVGNYLTTVNFPSATSIGAYAFYYCSALTSVYLGSDAPTVGANAFTGSSPTIYATDSTSTNWTSTLGGRPVVRAPLYADAVTIDGAGVVERIAAATNGLLSTELDPEHTAWLAGDPLGDLATTNALTSAITAADALPYAITSASGTATVSRANGWLQSLDMTGPLVLNIGDGSASYISQVNLSVSAGTNQLTYTTSATNTVTGLSDITATNTTTYLLYSPMFETGWEASEL